MTPEERQLLLESWQRLRPHADRLALVFFERLFELDPGCRPMFAGAALEAQFLRFAHMLAELATLQADDPQKLVLITAELGRRHAGYGVRDAHYRAVEGALAAMLDAGPASCATPEVRDAWREAYELVTTIMRRARRRHPTIHLRHETTDMPITIGHPVPHVAVDSYVRGLDEPWRMTLADYRGKWVVLFFYPRDFTFVCPTEIEAFARLHPRFTREDAVVVAASTDSYYCHKAWYETDRRLAGVEYPVIADTALQLTGSLGVLREDGAAMRATFILDPDGIIRHLLVNDLDVARNPEETLRTLQALKTGGLCPVGWRPGQPTISPTRSEPDVTVGEAA